MNIKSYKKLHSNLYEVVFDNGEKIKLFDDIILKYELLINRNIDQNKLKIILQDNLPYEAYYKAIKYLSKRMRTKLEIKNYLLKEKYDLLIIEEVIKKLEKNSYMDDDKYINSFIHDSLRLSLKGPQKIHMYLQQLGIAEEKILRQLLLIDEKIWIGRIQKIIDKKFKTNKNSIYIFKKKIYNELINLGYDSGLINQVFANYIFENNSNFEKEADKIWLQLSKKFDDKELELKFKQKMYYRGYTSEEINLYIEKKILE